MMKTLQDVFLHTLQDIYYAENQLVKSLQRSRKRRTAASLSRHSRIIWRRPSSM